LAYEHAVTVEVPALDAVLEHDLDEGPVVRVHDSRLLRTASAPSAATGGASGMPPSRNTPLML
jgi:hypothetical protein